MGKGQWWKYGYVSCEMLASDRAVKNVMQIKKKEEVFGVSLFSFSLAVRSWWEAHPCAAKSRSANIAVLLVIVGSLRISGGNPPWIICTGSGWAGLLVNLWGSLPSFTRGCFLHRVVWDPFWYQYRTEEGWKDFDKLKIFPRRQRLPMCARLVWAYWCNALMFHFGGVFFLNAELEKSCSDDVKIWFLCKLPNFCLCRHRILGKLS